MFKKRNSAATIKKRVLYSIAEYVYPRRNTYFLFKSQKSMCVFSCCSLYAKDVFQKGR